MSSPIMALSETDLHHIGQYVRAELPGWLKELGPGAVLGSELLERIVRVEEELKTQREILLNHVRSSNERFKDMNRRFEDVNKRFDDVNKRFEDNNKRHSTTQWALGVGFVMLATLVTLYRFLG